MSNQTTYVKLKFIKNGTIILSDTLHCFQPLEMSLLTTTIDSHGDLYSPEDLKCISFEFQRIRLNPIKIIST